MKFKILILLVLASQLLFSQGFKGGFFGGLVSSQVDGDIYAGYTKFGIQAGVYSNLELNESLFLLTELKYIQKGSQHSNKDNPYDNFKIKLSYIEVPVLINYQLNERFVFGAGLSYGILLGAEVEDGVGTIPKEKLDYNNFDINAQAQVRYILGEHLWLDLRMAYSVFYIKESTPRQFNNLLSISLGYEF